jgi:hypothetical protein
MIPGPYTGPSEVHAGVPARTRLTGGRSHCVLQNRNARFDSWVPRLPLQRRIPVLERNYGILQALAAVRSAALKAD